MKNTFKVDSLLIMYKTIFAHLFIGLLQSQTNQLKKNLKLGFPTLNPIKIYQLSIPHPSGLSMGKNNKSLWMVSDKTGSIYQTDLSGKIIYSLNINGHDLEGVHYDSHENIIWVTEERKREVLQVDPKNGVVTHIKVDFPGKKNSGFEGICLDSVQQIFVLNEKKPAAILKVNSDESFEKMQIFGDAIKDCSGICADLQHNRFWIVSDQSQLLFLWDRKTGFQKAFTLPVKKAEGIAIDFKTNLVYIVSDSTEKLYVFNLPFEQL